MRRYCSTSVDIIASSIATVVAAADADANDEAAADADAEADADEDEEAASPFSSLSSASHLRIHNSVSCLPCAAAVMNACLAPAYWSS